MEAFAFTTLRGVELSLFGRMLSYTDDIKTGVVEHAVLKRVGAIHQTQGAAPIRSEFRCTIVGTDAQAQYRRLVDAVRQEAEGQLVHPRFGLTRAVCESVSSSESPGDAADTIEFTIRFTETGLRDAPKPATSALAQASAAKGAEVAAAGLGQGGSVATACSAIGARSAGFVQIAAAVESGLGDLADAEASLSALAADVAALDALDAPKPLRSAAVLTLALALQARQRIAAGRPPIVVYTLTSRSSLGALCQRLYGSRGREIAAEIQRANRIRRPFAIDAGTVLLLPDPAAVV